MPRPYFHSSNLSKTWARPRLLVLEPTTLWTQQEDETHTSVRLETPTTASEDAVHRGPENLLYPSTSNLGMTPLNLKIHRALGFN